MPSKVSANKSVAKPAPHPVRDAADAVFRAAKESCHQHSRLNQILALGVDDSELGGIAEIAEHCDKLLELQVARYEKAAAEGRGKESEELWKGANSLWLAARDYCRRHAQNNDGAAARLKRHTASKFGELTVEYELEMSARLAMRQSVEAYARLRPEIAERRGMTPIS